MIYVGKNISVGTAGFPQRGPIGRTRDPYKQKIMNDLLLFS
jgi:hypothetical protein